MKGFYVIGIDRPLVDRIGGQEISRMTTGKYRDTLRICRNSRHSPGDISKQDENNPHLKRNGTGNQTGPDVGAQIQSWRRWNIRCERPEASIRVSRRLDEEVRRCREGGQARGGLLRTVVFRFGRGPPLYRRRPIRRRVFGFIDLEATSGETGRDSPVMGSRAVPGRLPPSPHTEPPEVMTAGSTPRCCL